MNISGFSKPAVLAALYNAAKPQGMGFLHYDPKPMMADEAAELLKHQTYFDYLKGRVMKIDLKNDEVRTGAYNRDNGQNAAELAVEELKMSGKEDSSVIRAVHHENTLASANQVKQHLGDKGHSSGATITMGFADVAHVLGPAVDKAIQKK